MPYCDGEGEPMIREDDLTVGIETRFGYEPVYTSFHPLVENREVMEMAAILIWRLRMFKKLGMQRVSDTFKCGMEIRSTWRLG